MDAIEFACILQQVQNMHCIDIDSDIVCKIFEYYIQSYYDNYTLLELIYELTLSRIQILCPWNKKELIKMINEYNIIIPEKQEFLENNIWEYVPENNSIFIYKCAFEFQDGDVIKTSDGNIYSIELVSNVNSLNIVHLYNISTQEKIILNINEFMYMIDNTDITILQNADRFYYTVASQDSFVPPL